MKKNLWTVALSLSVVALLGACSGGTSSEGSQALGSSIDEDVETHMCTFKNYDGTILWSTSVNHGGAAVYQGPTPTRDDDVSSLETIHWTFSSWNKSLDKIEEDTVFTAQYYAPNALKCTFLNYDGSVLFVQYHPRGDRAVYEGETPTRPDDNDGEGTILRYAFVGWDNSLKNIQADMTYTAQYEASAYYECRFVNYDGELLESTWVRRGDTAFYHGEDPTRPEQVEGTTVTRFFFEGWDQKTIYVDGPRVFTARYSTTRFTGHKVTFLEEDGTELGYYYCKEGNDAAYPYTLDLPFSYDEETVTLFAGWEGSLTNIMAPTTVKATHVSIPRRMAGEYPQTQVKDDEIIGELNKTETTDEQGYYVYQNERYARTGTEETGYSYFKVEPIRWRVLSHEEGDLFLVSEFVLDGHRFNESYQGTDEAGIYPNNYKASEIRTWLNEDFLKTAFHHDDSFIKVTAVDNSPESTVNPENPYACETSEDKVFLLSYQEAASPEYGFLSSDDRNCKASDYAEVMGVYRYKVDSPIEWWTRSPHALGYTSVTTVKTLMFGSRQVTSSLGVRPALHLTIEEGKTSEQSEVSL